MDTSRGKALDDAPGVIGLKAQDMPPLPDDVLSNRNAGHVDPRKWFSHPEHPLEIEIGCGKGGFILQHAQAHPEVNILGIEIAKEFYFYTADRLRRHGVRNVRMFAGDAASFLAWRCPDAIVQTLHLYYSDPWPKTKHHKNRVVQQAMLGESWRVLVPGGELRVVTDHDELWAWCEQHFAGWTSGEGAKFERLVFSPPTWADEGETVGTNYERKFTGERAAGKKPHACVLRKIQ